MKTETTFEPSLYEQVLIGIVRTLPRERVMQILYYARYIQSQTSEDFGFLDDDETEEEILANEERWDAQFATTQEGLQKIAENASRDSGRADYADALQERWENCTKMKFRTIPNFWRQFHDFLPDIQRRAYKAFRLWRSHPFATSLRFKRVSEREPSYSVRIGRGYRVPGLLEGYIIY